MREPVVSFVLPVYNMEEYLSRCLKSILSQSITDYEVIIVDDGSTDSSSKIIEEFLEDKRFNYIYQNNAGAGAARNQGIALSNGKWIAFVDPDDYLEPDYLEVLLEKSRPETDIISCCCKSYIKGQETVYHFYNSDRVFSEGKTAELGDGKTDLYLELMDVDFCSESPRTTAIGVPWGKLYKTSFLKTHELEFPTQLPRLQDNIFNMWAFDKALEIRYIDQPLYVYTLDNITEYNRRYHPNAPQYLEMVCRLRREFLSEKGYLANSVIQKTYCKEVFNRCNVMLKKYYLHPENDMTYSEKVKAMDARFSQPLYQEVFVYKKEMPEQLVRRIRLTLLIKRQYRTLFCFQHLVDVSNKVKSVLMGN